MLRKYIVSALMLFSATGAFAGATGERYDLTGDDRSIIENSVKEHLIDPDSAKFSEIRASIDRGEIAVCGSVNAKNRMGGYTGKAPFYGLLKKSGGASVFLVLSDIEASRSAWVAADSFCEMFKF